MNYRKTQAKGNASYVCYIHQLPVSEDPSGMEIGQDAAYLKKEHPATKVNLSLGLHQKSQVHQILK
jgi:hypothetical protein